MHSGKAEEGDPDLSRSTDKTNTLCSSNHSTVCVCLHCYNKTKGVGSIFHCCTTSYKMESCGWGRNWGGGEGPLAFGHMSFTPRVVYH